MRRKRLLVSSLAFISLVTLAAFLAPVLSPYSPAGFEEKSILERPSWRHWMGTDNLGRDLLTRVLYGARVSMTVGIGTALIALAIGTIYGLISGYAGGQLDHLLMRVVDIFYGLPDLLIFILLSLILGRNIAGVLLALGLVTWVRFARITRGQVLQAKELIYVEGARAIGASGARIIFRHILPNALSPVLVSATFGVAGAILTESALSFLGLGVPPDVATWGSILRQGQKGLPGTWWLALIPGVAIFATVTSYNLFGESLRDALDPRLKGTS